MIISFDRGFVFIKGIKVGGSSVELFLSQVLEESAVVAPANFGNPQFRPRNYRMATTGHAFVNHSGAAEVRRELGGPAFDAMRCALILRNPFEKVRSFYYFQLGKGVADMTVDRAIEDCTSEATRALDHDGRTLVTDLLFYERFDHDLAAFFTAVDLPFSGRLGIFEKAWQRKAFGHIPVVFSAAQVAAIHDKFAFEFDAYAAADLAGLAANPEA